MLEHRHPISDPVQRDAGRPDIRGLPYCHQCHESAVRTACSSDSPRIDVASTLSFYAIIGSLPLNQIPNTRFARLALIANLGIAIAGATLTVYLLLTTH